MTLANEAKCGSDRSFFVHSLAILTADELLLQNGYSLA